MQRITRTFGTVLVLAAVCALTPGGWAQEGYEGGPGDHPAAPGADHGQAGGHEEDAGLEAAEALAVHTPPSWYGKVITGAVALFVLAATLGSVAVLTKAPEPQEPDHHDDHGHDHGGHGHH